MHLLGAQLTIIFIEHIEQIYEYENPKR